MEPEYFDVMVDVETGGTDPSHSPMIQLAAVKFNLKERTVDSSNMFNRCLRIPSGRYWDEDTRIWWGRQKQSILQDIYARMEDPKVVMDAFADWCGYSHKQPLRFWSKPISFDWVFVASYFNRYEIPNPFHYRWATDVNSFIRGLAGDSEVETHRVDFQGDAHNALYDVINQIGCVFSAMDHFQKEPAITA